MYVSHVWCTLQRIWQSACHVRTDGNGGSALEELHIDAPLLLSLVVRFWMVFVTVSPPASQSVSIATRCLLHLRPQVGMSPLRWLHLSCGALRSLDLCSRRLAPGLLAGLATGTPMAVPADALLFGGGGCNSGGGCYRGGGGCYTGGGLRALRKCVLRYGCGLRDEDVAALARGCPELVHLGVQWSVLLSDDVVHALADSSRTSGADGATITATTATASSFAEAAGAPVAGAVQFKALRSLRLTGVALSARAVAVWARACPQLRRLALSVCPSVHATAPQLLQLLLRGTDDVGSSDVALEETQGPRAKL